MQFELRSETFNTDVNQYVTFYMTVDNKTYHTTVEKECFKNKEKCEFIMMSIIKILANKCYGNNDEMDVLANGSIAQDNYQEIPKHEHKV